MDPVVQMPGDILLVRRRGLKPYLNVFAQKLARPRARCSFSHALLSLTPGIFIHSDKGRGVDLDYVEDLCLESKYRGTWKVIRHREVEADERLRSEIYQRAIFHFQKSYNLLFGVKPLFRRMERGSLDSSAFCSEFIARVYKDVGLPLASRPPERVLPADLEALSSLDGWQDITLRYQAARSLDAELRRSCMALIQLLRDLRAVALRNNQLVEVVGRANEWINGLGETLENIQLEDLQKLRDRISLNLSTQYRVCLEVLVPDESREPADVRRLFFDQKILADVASLDMDALRSRCVNLLDHETKNVQTIFEYFKFLGVMIGHVEVGRFLPPDVLGTYEKATAAIASYLADFESYQDCSAIAQMIEEYEGKADELKDSEVGVPVCDVIIAMLKNRRRFRDLDLRAAFTDLAASPFDLIKSKGLLSRWNDSFESEDREETAT